MLRAIAPRLELALEYLETGEHTDPLTRLYAVATKEEAELLDDLAVRAGLLWARGGEECQWLNREEATRCTACGKLMNPAFRTAMSERRIGPAGQPLKVMRGDGSERKSVTRNSTVPGRSRSPGSGW